MYQLITTLTILLTLFLSNAVKAQVLEKKPFKDATTIRLYVTDATESAAIARFTAFINKTSWTVQSPTKVTKDPNAGLGVDTLRTDVGSLFDFMMGEFQGQLVFYADRDVSDKLYIAISGYASALSWGGSHKSKMKKGGKDSNWPQRALFKQLDSHLSDYPNAKQIMYSDE